MCACVHVFVRVIISYHNILFLLTADRMTISEAVQHHFIAPELAIKFLLPQLHGPGI